MRNDIRDKLEMELNKPISEEPQVIYILSRVRKLLEIDKDEKKYKILKFYCDWALHSEIDNIEPVKDLVDKILAGDNKMILHLVLAFNIFHVEFNKFLRDYKFTSSIYKNPTARHAFNRLLSQIYTDTPLIIKTTQKTKLTWKGISEGSTSSYGGSFKIEKIK